MAFAVDWDEIGLAVLTVIDERYAMMEVQPVSGAYLMPTKETGSGISFKYSETDTIRDCLVIVLSSPFIDATRHGSAGHRRSFLP